MLLFEENMSLFVNHKLLFNKNKSAIDFHQTKNAINLLSKNDLISISNRQKIDIE